MGGRTINLNALFFGTEIDVSVKVRAMYIPGGVTMVLRTHTHNEQNDQPSPLSGFIGVRIMLWVVWALVVAGSAALYWNDAIRASGSVDMVGLGVRILLSGAVGMVVLTLIEQRFDPERFND